MPFEARQGALPTGTVTFAFTDIEGSTARWERHPNEMERAVRRHDELMRSAFTSHGGHIFKTVGDAFCVAFWRPADAVAAMLGAQGALAAEDFTAVDGLRVRAAVHTGTASERDGDYFGPAVNRVARLLAIGHGGQVLVSGVTTGLVQGALPLLVIDAWEHAWYLQYLNEKAKFFDAIWNVLNWKDVGQRFEHAQSVNLALEQVAERSA